MVFLAIVRGTWRVSCVFGYKSRVSATRPPTRYRLQERHADALDDLEELGDDAIIAQQTEAHAPKPRTNVANEARSVVITDHPVRPDTQPPSRSHPRSSGEATLVIRDRRDLDAIRKGIAKRQFEKGGGGQPVLYTWVALGLAAFVLGGLFAFLATDSRAGTADPAPNEALSGAPVVSPAPALTQPPRAVKLDDLPVEPKHDP